jgi:hypothetical protein
MRVSVLWIVPPAGIFVSPHKAADGIGGPSFSRVAPADTIGGFIRNDLVF